MTENISDAIALRRAESLTAIVQRELERMIVVGELRAGDRLNEQALAQRFGVSRGPVREAMRALECANLVSTRLNQGFFVREISSEEIAEIYDMRAVVYGFICARLATTISAEALAALDAAIEEMDAAIATGDGKEYYRLNLAFHEQTIICAAHNCAQQTYQSLINESHLARQRSLVEPERMRQSNAEHRHLVAALKAGDADLARELGHKHVLAGRGRWKASVAEEDAPVISERSQGTSDSATLTHE